MSDSPRFRTSRRARPARTLGPGRCEAGHHVLRQADPRKRPLDLAAALPLRPQDVTTSVRRRRPASRHLCGTRSTCAGLWSRASSTRRSCPPTITRPISWCCPAKQSPGVWWSTRRWRRGCCRWSPIASGGAPDLVRGLGEIYPCGDVPRSPRPSAARSPRPGARRTGRAAAAREPVQPGPHRCRVRAGRARARAHRGRITSPAADPGIGHMSMATARGRTAPGRKTHGPTPRRGMPHLRQPLPVTQQFAEYRGQVPRGFARGGQARHPSR